MSIVGHETGLHILQGAQAQAETPPQGCMRIARRAPHRYTGGTLCAHGVARGGQQCALRRSIGCIHHPIQQHKVRLAKEGGRAPRSKAAQRAVLRAHLHALCIGRQTPSKVCSVALDTCRAGVHLCVQAGNAFIQHCAARLEWCGPRLQRSTAGRPHAHLISELIAHDAPPEFPSARHRETMRVVALLTRHGFGNETFAAARKPTTLA